MLRPTGFDVRVGSGTGPRFDPADASAWGTFGQCTFLFFFFLFWLYWRRCLSCTQPGGLRRGRSREGLVPLPLRDLHSPPSRHPLKRPLLQEFPVRPSSFASISLTDITNSFQSGSTTMSSSSSSPVSSVNAPSSGTSSPPTVRPHQSRLYVRDLVDDFFSYYSRALQGRERTPQHPLPV